MAFHLFKACTRLPMILGVPLKAGGGAFLIITVISLSTSIFAFVSIIPVWLIMREICKKDDKAFNLLYAWFTTKARYPSNLKRNWGNATSYSPNRNKLSDLNK